MSEENTTEEQNAPEEQPTTEEAKTFTQEDVDKIVSDRLTRERAKFEGYEDYKSRAEKADELSQKLTEQTSRADAAELKALRTSVSAEHGVPLSALTATSEEDLTAQAKELLEWRGTPAAVKRETNSSGNSNAESGMNAKQRAAQALASLRG